MPSSGSISTIENGATFASGAGAGSGTAAASGWRTFTPSPTRTLTSPFTSSAISASRTDVRDTPKRSASSRSGGR